MPLIVEDGTGTNTAANSYVSVAAARSYASDRGLAFPADDTVAAQQLLLAMDYLEGKRDRYIGTELLPDQPLAWPRYYVLPNSSCTYVQNVSSLVVKAQCELASIAQTINLFPTQSGPQIVLEQVGPLVTEYSERNGAMGLPFLPKITEILRPILAGSSGQLRVYRA